jgi:integrase/recombinase XerD
MISESILTTNNLNAMTKEQYIEEYRKVLIIRRLALNTTDTYVSCLNVFLSWCENLDIFPPQITESQMRDFLCSLESQSYLRQMRGTLDNFYTYVLHHPQIMSGMPFPRKSNSLPDYFTPHELLRIFESVRNNKQRIILKLQYACALRVGEVVKVKWSDFSCDFDGYILRVCGKGSHTDVLPVPNETIQEIIQVFGNKFGLNEYLFKGQFKEFYSERSVQQIIGRAMDECKIFKDGSTHLLRHSRATHLIQSGVSLRHVQVFLRHKKSTTTEIYTHLDKRDLREAMNHADGRIAAVPQGMMSLNPSDRLLYPLLS